ncbi:stage II sporulation protein M [Bacillus haynesii]|uniref:stage II sporulation protein M n=1 Tax=Bacillus haynesii TaxID=1925021 RepID=UPI00227FB383|nr:stage II sporulation protein M [Bacillus haynesii]MCY8005442.1 stage II sporulation protein M [Bacillus haynesii]
MLHNNKTARKIIAIFFISLLLGILYGEIFLEPDKMVAHDLNHSKILLKVVTKNMICLVIMVIGTFLGKLFIKTFLGVNGFLIGLVISKFQSVSYFLLILPHGIIEIPTLLFLGYILLKAINQNAFDRRTVKGVLISGIMILVSALIESYVTPNIVISVLF